LQALAGRHSKSARAKDGRIGSRNGLAHGFKSLGGAEKLGAVDVSDLATGGEGDGDRAGRDLLGEFSDGEDVIGIHSKEGSMDFSTEGRDGRAK